MRRTFLVLVYTLEITVICYPCQAEPAPYGYDYLGEDKIDPDPKRKPNANVYFSRLGRNWFGQNSGFTLTNEQQQYIPKNEVSLPNSPGSDFYESSEGLTLPSLLIGHNLYAPTKELSITKSLHGPDWYEPNKVVKSKRQHQYANKKELFLSNCLHGFDLYVQDSLYHTLNEQKKELSLPSPNGQDSYGADIGLILSNGQQNKPDNEIFLSNSPSGDDRTDLEEGMSFSKEPTEQIQCANKEKLSLPKAVGHIWYRPNTDVYLPRRDEHRQWDKPTIGIILSIITKKSYYDVYEALNTQNLRKIEEYIVKVVMRRQEGIQLNDKIKDEIAFKFTMPVSRFKSKHRTNEDSSLYSGQNSQNHRRQKYTELSKARSKKIYINDNNHKRFKIEQSRQDSHKNGGHIVQKHNEVKGRNKKYDKNRKSFKIVNAKLNGQFQNHPRGFMQYVSNFQNNHDTFENNYYTINNNYNNFQYHNSENQIVDGQSIGPNHGPLANIQEHFGEEYGPKAEILVRRPDNWSKNYKRPKHFFK